MAELAPPAPALPTNIPKVRFWEVSQEKALKRSEERKTKLLHIIDKVIRKQLREGTFEYPDIVKLAKDLNIHHGVLSRWLREDKEFKAKLASIEELGIQDCRKVVYNGKNKQVYLAMQLLQARAPEFQKEIKHSGTFAHFHIVSNVRSGSMKVNASVSSVVNEPMVKSENELETAIINTEND